VCDVSEGVVKNLILEVELRVKIYGSPSSSVIGRKYANSAGVILKLVLHVSSPTYKITHQSDVGVQHLKPLKSVWLYEIFKIV
jgi:hypothetical protein